jgi:hypothetical protein
VGFCDNWEAYRVEVYARVRRAVQRDGESESARVSAARTILEQALKAVDMEDLTERVEALERAQSGKDPQ